MHRAQITLDTSGRGAQDITSKVSAAIAESGIEVGLCHVFCHHTSASLIVCENADPRVLRDLDAFLARLVPDGDPMFLHDQEGPDDMPAHVRSILTHTGLTLPVEDGGPALGTWQGIFLYEHRAAPHRRRVSITVWGDHTGSR